MNHLGRPRWDLMVVQRREDILRIAPVDAIAVAIKHKHIHEMSPFINFARFGMLPSAIHGRISVQVAASNPMIATFGSFFMSEAD